MIETRLDMQRAKRQSFARARSLPDESAILADPDAAASAPPLIVTAADDLPAMMDADPTIA